MSMGLLEICLVTVLHCLGNQLSGGHGTQWCPHPLAVPTPGSQEARVPRVRDRWEGGQRWAAPLTPTLTGVRCLRLPSLQQSHLPHPLHPRTIQAPPAHLGTAAL